MFPMKNVFLILFSFTMLCIVCLQTSHLFANVVHENGFGAGVN